MATKVNQQQTLYRFRSLRAPELSNPTGEGHRFVFNIDLGRSVFYNAALHPNSGESAWNAMLRISQTFATVGTVKDLELEFKDYYAIANWIARHKSFFDAEELYAKIKLLAPITDPTLLNLLWDNLFYQVVRQDNFYVKELLVELLVVQNMLVWQRTLSQTELVKILPLLANASVVLPEEMYPESTTGTTTLAKGEPSVNFSGKGLSKSSNVADAQFNISRNEVATDELIRLQNAYFEDYDLMMRRAIAEYDKKVEEAYAASTVVEEIRKECPSGCEYIYYDYQNLKLPNFSFTPPTEVDPKILKNELTEDSYYVVEILKLINLRTYEAIIDGVKASTRRYSDTYYKDLSVPGSKVVSVGGMLFKSAATADGPESFVGDLEIPFIAYFLATSLNPKKGHVSVNLQMGYQSADCTYSSFSAAFDSGQTYSSDTANLSDTANGNFLNMLFFKTQQLAIPAGQDTISFNAELVLAGGTQISVTCELSVKGDRTSGIAKITRQLSSNNGEDRIAFDPIHFGVRRLGIADYKRVVAEICCYREAEVSHIENIMQGEFKSKTTTRERIEETTVTTEQSTETENLTDSSTTNRFEMQTEIAKVLQKQMQITAYANVTATYDPITLEVGGTFASNTSKEESNRQAVTEAKEVTQRAMERIVQKFREETIRKVTESFKDENSHIFDNRTGTGHVSGIYRFINAVYKNSIYNYGKRLMYEFMVPQPSKLYRFGMEVTTGVPAQGNSQPALTEPASPTSLGILNATSINEYNYINFAARYKADVDPVPPLSVRSARAYQGKGENASTVFEFNDIKIPEGYKASGASYDISLRRSGNNNLSANLIIADFNMDIAKSGGAGTGYITNRYGFINIGSSAIHLETVPVSVIGWDLGGFVLNVSVGFNRTETFYAEWQLKTYNAIIQAYEERMKEYRDSLVSTQDEDSRVFGTNPLFYRQIEKITLKKNCLGYIMPETEMGTSFSTGDDFTTYSVTQSQAMDDYASKAKFMEQAFEWDIMSYNFYPYYWGKRSEWIPLYQSEDDDPVFRSFMQAGMARVIVSVTPGFEKAVMYYMRTGRIWNGGQMPIIGDPLYRSIVDELMEQEYTVEETWETVVPTSLIGIQEEGVLVGVKGLPCSGSCKDDEQDNPLIANINKLEPEVPPIS